MTSQFTPLPISITVLKEYFSRYQMKYFFRKPSKSLLKPAEICDLLKVAIIVMCTVFMFCIDTSMMYHLIKSQSVIKLYIFYNMLEVQSM